MITIVHGRHDHLRRQQQMIARSHRSIDDRIVVAIDDPGVGAIARRSLVDPPSLVVEVPGHPVGLPLAAARNAGAAAAIGRGAELLIFLDVDCLPDPTLVGSYVEAAGDDRLAGSLLSGSVSYLPSPPAGGYDLERMPASRPHPARPALPAGTWRTGGDPRLFWSLSFAVTTPAWTRAGGFHERYLGYGAEDTDFAFKARDAGIGLTWVGAAGVLHQWHPTRTPPTQHLDAILRNGALFASRWGRWPMEGWLADFATQGLIEWDEHGGGWRRRRATDPWVASRPEYGT